MAVVVELNPSVVAHERQRELTGAIGMMVALGSWAMMFAAVFFVYVALRSRTVSWPPPGFGPLPLWLPAINTAVIVASSYTLVRALQYLRAGQRRGALGGMVITLLLGLAFVALQVVMWRQLWLDGITMQTGSVGMVLYMMTGLHALHVLMGIGVLLYLVVTAARSLPGAPLRQKAMTLRLCGMYWHFVDAVWIAMFVGLFVV